jgi:DNA-binding FrmR family transcriptional regulator
MADRDYEEQAGTAQLEYLDEETRRDLTNRLSRIEGHVRSIKGMVNSRRCADEVLLQIAAVKAALNAVASSILDSELQACMRTCMEGSADERLNRVIKMVTTLLKQA